MLENMYHCGAYCFAAGVILATIGLIVANYCDEVLRKKGK